jgi:hypothetical protein
LLLVVLPLVVVSSSSPPAAAAPIVPFTSTFHTQDNGAIGIFGNTVETCPASASGCTTAKTGVAPGGVAANRNNNVLQHGLRQRRSGHREGQLLVG